MNIVETLKFWNATANDALKNDFSVLPGQTIVVSLQGGPTLSARAIAMVHLAIHDAYYFVFAPAKNYSDAVPPAGLVAGDISTATTAMAVAAFTTLSKLYPAQLPFLQSRLLESTGMSMPTGKGAVLGKRVGQRILELRRLDSTADARYTARREPDLTQVKEYYHDVDPDNAGQGFHGPTFGKNPPFATTAYFDLDAPPGKDPAKLAAYKTSLAEVIKLGGDALLPTTKRTAEQTEIGLFWAYDGTNLLGTPPRLYNQLLMQILADSAFMAGMALADADWVDLLTLFHVAMADAAINAWQLKYRFEFWRPVVGARWFDPTQTAPQPFWLPLGSPNTNTNLKAFTPPVPAYPSGHATFGGAAFHILRLFLKKRFTYDDVNNKNKLKLMSDELNGVSTDAHGTVRPYAPRTFNNLAHIIHENAKSRLYLGVHWLFDSFDRADSTPDTGPVKGIYTEPKVGGVPVGIQIAENIFDGYKVSGILKPPAAIPAPLPNPAP